MSQNFRNIIMLTLVLICLPLFVFSDTTRKMIKEGEAVYLVYFDQSGTEVAREECKIPKDLQMTLTTLSFSPYYGIKSGLKSGAIPDGDVKIFDEEGTLRLLETNKDVNIGEILGRFAEKRRLSGKKVLIVTDTGNKENAKELKIFFA